MTSQNQLLSVLVKLHRTSHNTATVADGHEIIAPEALMDYIYAMNTHYLQTKAPNLQTKVMFLRVM